VIRTANVSTTDAPVAFQEVICRGSFGVKLTRTRADHFSGNKLTRPRVFGVAAILAADVGDRIMRDMALGALFVLVLAAGTSVSIHPASANMVATPSTIDFGFVLIGATESQPITLSADSGFIVGSAGGSGINVPFSFDQGTFNSDFTVFHSIESFTPVTLGLVTGDLIIAECPPVGPCIATDIPLRGIGVDSLPVPEPSGLLLLAMGALIVMFGTPRRRVAEPTADGGQPA